MFSDVCVPRRVSKLQAEVPSTSNGIKRFKVEKHHVIGGPLLSLSPNLDFGPL